MAAAFSSIFRWLFPYPHSEGPVLVRTRRRVDQVLLNGLAKGCALPFVLSTNINFRAQKTLVRALDIRIFPAL